MSKTLLLGNNLETLKTLADNSVDSVVTDPPYGLSFMGKKWDYDVPSVELWREVYRVLKPGGHVLSFGGTRTYHRLVVAIEDAGFEIRDQIQWLYGSGFPKSQNVGKVLGKQGSDEAPKYEGWGTALKPANEPICVARKPLEKGLTIAANVLKWGTGAINIDETRISTDEKLSIGSGKLMNGLLEGNGATGSNPGSQHVRGRWPANVILDEEAAAILDIQAEAVSRFFYVAKASKRERNAGLESASNIHPTVKPVKLMEYLIKLVTPQGGTVLDPFMGSGTTGVAAARLGFQFIGCELDEAYLEIASKRIESATENVEINDELDEAALERNWK